MDRAIKLAPEYGVRRAVPLPVSAPFHCALMKPAADRMAEALAQHGFQSRARSHRRERHGGSRRPIRLR